MKNLRFVILLAGLLLLAPGAFGQVQTLLPSRLPGHPDYLHGHSWFPNGLAPYRAMDVPPPELGNSIRVDKLLREGQLMLSLSDAIALALENNLDIAIQRLNTPIADLDILRTKAGAMPRGVRTSVTSAST